MLPLGFVYHIVTTVRMRIFYRFIWLHLAMHGPQARSTSRGSRHKQPMHPPPRMPKPPGPLLRASARPPVPHRARLAQALAHEGPPVHAKQCDQRVVALEAAVACPLVEPGCKVVHKPTAVNTGKHRAFSTPVPHHTATPLKSSGHSAISVPPRTATLTACICCCLPKWVLCWRGTPGQRKCHSNKLSAFGISFLHDSATPHKLFKCGGSQRHRCLESPPPPSLSPSHAPHLTCR